MSPERDIRSVRIIEWALQVIFIASALGVGWLLYNVELSWYELYAAFGSLGLVLLLLFFVQRRVDALIAVSLAQSNFLQDDAFFALFDRSPVAYATIDSVGRIVEVNSAAVKLFRAEVDALHDTDFATVVAADQELDSTVLMGKIQAGVTVNDTELKILTVDGEERWVLLSVIKLRADGLRLLSFIDITEKKRVDTAKSEFVALATHQLRTPIAAIRWNAELLTKSMLATQTEAQDRYLNKIQRNVLRMITLINDFLSVSKLEMGTFATDARELNLSVFFDSIVDEFGERISQKNIVIDRNDEPPQLHIRADERLLHIVVSNLVSNAVKYLNNGGKLQMTYATKNDWITIVVADNGIGIPEAELPQLFTKFYRASNAQSHQTEGTGLGLYIVKQSVERMGGTISVASSEDKGAAFSVLLPVNMVAAPKIG